MAKKKSQRNPTRKKARKKSAKPFLPMCRCLTCGEWYRQPEEYMHHPKLDCHPCVKKKRK